MPKKTLLLFNVHFAPNSFGGATVVAENLAAELASKHDWRVVAITSHQDAYAVPYSIVRYTTGQIDVLSVVVPEEGALTYEERYDNRQFVEAIEGIIDRLSISVAHIHSIQSIGIGVIALLKSRGIPVVTTVHDCWWLCERMFMIDSRGRYCHQTTIDLRICRHCVIDADKARIRKDRLHQALGECDLLLFPSEFQRSLYLCNDFPAHKCRVNKNGVLPPAADYERLRRRRDEGLIRFGFVGGPGNIKGAPLIRLAFSELPQHNYQLLVVDGARNRGLSWANSFNWKLPGEVRMIPPYNRETMDAFFASIDVLLFPSQWKESFGLTVREAIIRGVWVIATDGGGLAEDCIDGENADLIPMDGSHEALKAAIERILTDGHPPKVRRRQATTVANQAVELSAILDDILPRPRPLPQGDQKMPTPELLLICGMHRSGTSAVAGELAAHGGTLPANLIERNEGNPKGFIESESVIRVNDETLALFGSHWRDPSPLPNDWLGIAQERGQLNAAVEVLKNRPPGAHPLIIKDPRICRLLPLWLSAAHYLDMPTSALIVLRNPIAVADSLWKRNHIPTSHTHQLWARYHIDLIAALGKTDYQALEFEHFAANPIHTLAALRMNGFTFEPNGEPIFFENILVGNYCRNEVDDLGRIMQDDYIRKRAGRLFDLEQLKAYYEMAGGDRIANERRHYGAVSMILDTVVNELKEERANNKHTAQSN